METYKYMPYEFKGILGLAEDLTNFYIALEKYKHNRCNQSELMLKQCSIELHYTLKHRKVEGSISPSLANEITMYLEDLLND